MSTAAAQEAGAPRRSLSRALTAAGSGRLAVATVTLAASGSTTLVFNVLLARRLGPVRFGEVARTLALAMAAAQIPMSSIVPALGREVRGADPDHRFAAALASLPIVAATAVVSAGLFVGGSLIGLAPDDAQLVTAGCSFVLVYPVYFALKLSFFALDRVSVYGAFELSADALFFAALLAGIGLVGWRLLPLIFALSYGVFCVGAVTYLHWRRAGRFRFKLRGLLGFSGLSFVATYASVGRVPVLLALAGLVGGSATAGPLAAALALAAPLMLLPQAAGMLAFVDGAATASEPRRQEELARLHRLVGVGACLAVVGTILLANPLGTFLVGRGFRASELTLLAVGMVPLLVGVTAANALAGAGRVHVTAAIAVAGFAVGILATAVGTALYGLTGAAVGIASAAAVTGVGNLRAAGRWLSLGSGLSIRVAVAVVCAVTLSLVLPRPAGTALAAVVIASVCPIVWKAR